MAKNDDIDDILAALGAPAPNPADAGKSLDDMMNELSALGDKVQLEEKSKGKGPPLPAFNKPAESKPAASKPAASKPAASKPAASKPAAAKPPAAKPAASKPTAPPSMAPYIQVLPLGPNKHDPAALARDIGLSSLSDLIKFELGPDLSYFPAAGSADYKAAVANLKTYLKHINTALRQIDKDHDSGTVANNITKAYIVHSTTGVFSWGDARAEVLYLQRNFEKLAKEQYNPKQWDEILYISMFSFLSDPVQWWLPLRSNWGDDGVMMDEIRKLSGNPNLQFYFDWSISRFWKLDSGLTEAKAKHGLSLDSTWLPGLVQSCTEHKEICQGLKSIKNVVFKLDINNTVKPRTGSLYWQTCTFNVCPDTISFEIDFCWLFAGRMNPFNDYSIKKIAELPKTKEWKWMFMPALAVQEDNAAVEAREKWYKSLPPDQQQYYQRYV